MKHEAICDISNKDHSKIMNKKIGFRHFEQFTKMHQQAIIVNGF